MSKPYGFSPVTVTRPLVVICFALSMAACSEPTSPPETAIPAFREVVSSDVSWFEDSAGHEDWVLRGINMVMRDTPACRHLLESPGDLVPFKSTSKGTAEKPVFFITCGSANVWFSKADVETNAPVGEATSIGTSAARENCKQAIRVAAMKAEMTVESLRQQVVPRDFNNGRISVTLRAKLKTLEGEPLSLDGVCLFQGSEILEIKICDLTGACIT